MISETINLAIDYIISHIDENISIEDVSNHCHYSKYHLSRKFKEETGMNLYAFIKQMKMNQSAIRLGLEKERRVTDIGLDYGYSSTNFSVAFKKQHAIPPAKYRNDTKGAYFPSPYYEDGLSKFQTYEHYNEKIKIEMLDTCTIVYERYVGNYIEIKDKWQNFMKKNCAYLNEETQCIERYYDDPSVGRLDKCVYDLCITVPKHCSADSLSTIPGGGYAIYPYKGTVEEIYNAVQGMFHIWFPDSSYEMAERFSLNRYRIMDRKNMYVEMDICIPVKI